MDKKLAWQMTQCLRIHRLVTSYSWSTGWDPNYADTLQQLFICLDTGEEKWEPVEIVIEEVPNCPRYG